MRFAFPSYAVYILIQTVRSVKTLQSLSFRSLYTASCRKGRLQYAPVKSGIGGRNGQLLFYVQFDQHVR